MAVRPKYLTCLLVLFTCLACGRKSPDTSPGEVTEPVSNDVASAPDTKPEPEPAEPAVEARPRWHYEIQPSADLKTMRTRVCFEHSVPALLDAQMPEARWALVEARREPGGEALTQRVQGIDLSPLSPGDCVVYTQDLAATLKRVTGWRKPRAINGDLLMSSDYWLWKPKPNEARASIELTAAFDLPDGVAVSVPWPALTGEHVYRIPESTFTLKVRAAIGRFDVETLDVGGSTLRVALVGAPWQAKRRDLLDYIRESAGAVSLLYGEFPVPEAQILVVPGRGSGVGFGSATYGGGPTVTLHVGAKITRESLDDDWTAVHEMLHLGTPPLRNDSDWLAEGMATYLEPLLRARAGMITPEEAWEQIHDGFRRGSARGTGRTLREESDDMRKTGQYWRVYWAGAAILLIADVTLRQQGSSLDQEMKAMRDCCVPTDRVWSADELLRKAVSETTVVKQTAETYLNTSEFPDYKAAYKLLGLSFDRNGKVTMASDPASRALREPMVSASTN